jgi:A/G-specific adenine glycosylase
MRKPRQQNDDRHSRLVRSALRWYDQHRRDLPWRTNKSRYRVWISEIMLQQTQVTTVIPYYRRFLSHFPSVRSLAVADEAAVLRLWEGLGYYRRARQLHSAARIIVDRHRGRCPARLVDWLALPGIGRYTAGAILSIADDLPLPILEANTMRLYSRLLGERRSPGDSKTRNRLWQFAEQLVPNRRAGDLNQAMMEIGSQVCRPRDPLCERCPLRTACVARKENRVHRLPATSTVESKTRVRQVVVAIRRGDRILMRQSGVDERWPGLWDLARFESSRSHSIQRIEHQIREQTGLRVTIGDEEFALRFGVTRFAIDLRCHQALEVVGRLRASRDAHWKWIPRHALEHMPLNRTARRIVVRLGLAKVSKKARQPLSPHPQPGLIKRLDSLNRRR